MRELTAHEDVTGFLREVRPALEPREAEHSVLLGLALGLAREGGAVPPLWTVHDAQGLALAALQMPGRALVLASPRAQLDDATVAALVERLAASGVGVPGVEAVPAFVEGFCAAWRRRTGASVRSVLRMRLFRLDAVTEVPAVPGALREATRSDLDLVARWLHAFDVEALGHGDAARARAAAERRVGAREVFLWDDGEVRGMAAWSRPTWHGVAVNAVYTPPGARGRGVAAACTAALSRLLLARGHRFCVLFTDLANPTTNALYPRVGYRPVCDFQAARFEGA